MPKVVKSLSAYLMLYLGIACLPSYAQLNPASSAPGAIIQHDTQPWSLPGDQSQNLPQPPNQAPMPSAPSNLKPIEIDPFKDKHLAPNDKLKLFIKHIRLFDNTLLKRDDVEEIVAPYEDRELNFTDMQSIADKLTELYQQEGYINSEVYIPVQDFANQTLKLTALEAKVEEIAYKPARWFPKRGILPRIALKEGEPVNVNALSQSIRYINENPDLTLQARLRKGDKPGTSDILLQGASRFPIHMTPFMDNLGRQSIGKQRFGSTITDNNLLGFGDVSTSVLSFTSSSFGLVEQYTVPIGTHGTRLGMNYAYSNVKLGGSIAPLDIHSHSHIFTPLLSQPLWKSDRGGLISTLGFDFKNLTTDIFGTQLLHRDRLRVFRPSLEGYLNDRWGRTFANQEFGIGLDILGGSIGNTDLASRAGAGTKFFSMSGGLTRIQRLPWGTTGVLRGRYQYSPNRLLSAEQFQIGGAYTVRGYTEGRQLGDSGYLGNAEWYVPALMLPKRFHLPFMKQPLRQSLQFVGFTDFGESTVNNPVSGQKGHNVMLGCGFGLRVQLNRLLVGRLDVAFPMIRQDSDELRPRLHFGLQSTLF